MTESDYDLILLFLQYNQNRCVFKPKDRSQERQIRDGPNNVHLYLINSFSHQVFFPAVNNIVIPLRGVINMLCQSKSDFFWQLRSNVMGAAKVRKLWFGLGAVVQFHSSLLLHFHSLSFGS